jgi:hypothetical protein
VPAGGSRQAVRTVAIAKQRDAFIADGYAAWAAFGFSLAGWLLAGIVVAGLTGVFKRD